MTLPSTHDVALAAERRTAARLLLAHPLVASDGPHAALAEERSPDARRTVPTPTSSR